MTENNQTELINRGLDRFAQFLENELAQATHLAPQIPDKAFIFYGVYNDPELTQAEIEKAADLLMRMAIGVEEEAPLIIVFEYAPNEYQVIDFANEQRKRQAQEWLVSFREQSKQAIKFEINRSQAA